MPADDAPTEVEPTTIPVVHRMHVPVDAIVRPPPTMSALVARAAEYAQTSKAPNTQRAYESDLKTFRQWTDENLLPYMPTNQETVACYVAHLADRGKKASTIDRAVSAIMSAHKAAGFPKPKGERLEETLEGIRRQIGVAPKQKAPLMADDLRKIVDACDTGRADPWVASPSGDGHVLGRGELLAARDRLLLVLGWTGAFRRSELCALTVADVVKVRGGLEVTLRFSKTDQTGQSRLVAIPRASDAAYDAGELLGKWLELSGIQNGPLFRAVNRHGCFAQVAMTDRTVARVVKERAEAAGLDPAGYSGHSLRAGLVTEAAEAGRSLPSIMKVTGHRSERMATKYIRNADIWKDCASRGLL